MRWQGSPTVGFECCVCTVCVLRKRFFFFWPSGISPGGGDVGKAAQHPLPLRKARIVWTLDSLS